ncbi:MAG: hypothetical protein PHC88_05940 [Terrimicrobiaceae bacterium]|nr:hypothetical protein [Terrimicrobiaceae bacterium]
MAKYLLIVAVVISLATAGLGFVNRGNLTQAKADLASAQATLVTTRKNLDESKKALTSANATKDAATTDKEKIVADLEAARSDLTATKNQLTEAKTAATDKDTQIKTLTDENDQLKKDVANAGGAGAKDNTGAPAVDPAQLQELQALVASQNEKIKETTSQLADLRKKDDERRKKQMQQGLEGRVLAVNPAWNFVVLSIGDRQGVVTNAELLLKRGGQYLGKVRVTSVEPSTSIADIVANTLPAGVAVQPGDSVIYQQATEN